MRVRTLLSQRVPAAMLTATLGVSAVALAACTSTSHDATHGGASATPGGSATTSAPATSGATGAHGSSATNQPAPKDTKARPVPHKTVKAPTAGTIDQQVAAHKVVTLRAVALDHPARVGKGVTVALSQVRAINATARMPGEVAGPAVAVTVKFTNHSAKPLPLDNVVLNVAGSDKTPGNQMSTAPAKPLRGSLAKGKSASGTYVFTLSTQHRDSVTVTVFYSTSAPTAAFVGPVN